MRGSRRGKAGMNAVAGRSAVPSRIERFGKRARRGHNQADIAGGFRKRGTLPGGAHG